MKTRWIVVGFLIILFLLVASFCQEFSSGRTQQAKRIGSGMRPDIGMGMVMPIQIFPTSDGGVIIFFNRQLIKYDKNLNLIKQVEISLPEPSAPPMVSPNGREKDNSNP